MCIRAITAYRRSGRAITQLEWENVDFENSLLNIPKEKMKGRQGKVQDFILPLSKQAVTILRLLQKLNRCNSKFVFPSKKKSKTAYIERDAKQSTWTDRL